MAKKPYRKKKDNEELEDALDLGPGSIPLGGTGSMEELMATLGALLEEQDFESIDEANAFLDQLVRSGEPLTPSEPRTPLEEAQALIYEAFETGSSRKRISLARKALSISEDCADAYVLLADEKAKTVEEAKAFYEAGVQAGERALGEDAFEEYEGHFWGVLKTRPYMRARAGLAACLWEMGERGEAIAHYQEMLRLNPGDNQGLRYTLLHCLLEDRRDKDAEKLLKRYQGDPTAAWQYNAALLAFRKGGASRRANSQLAQALRHNPHVPDYLLGKRRMPREIPEYIQFGDETEAVDYVDISGPLWLQEPGALDWLRQAASAT
ncbi:MAG: tetratricopeptide repeat protein [Anaerolineae bacterium]|nr:tetratricopeptide repeat protein [Anaerolineae bacterium]